MASGRTSSSSTQRPRPSTATNATTIDARTRALMERTKAAAEAISPDGLPVEDRITRDMLIVIADQTIEQLDQGVHRLGVVDQINGPQTLLPQVCQFQPADTPERLEKFIARLEEDR